MLKTSITSLLVAFAAAGCVSQQQVPAETQRVSPPVYSSPAVYDSPPVYDSPSVYDPPSVYYYPTPCSNPCK